MLALIWRLSVAQGVLDRRGGRKCVHGDPLWHLCHTFKLGPDEPAPFSVAELPKDLMLKGQELAQGGGGWGNAGTRAPLLLPPFCPLGPAWMSI